MSIMLRRGSRQWILWVPPTAGAPIMLALKTLLAPRWHMRTSIALE